MASKNQYVNTIFTEKRNFQSGERELFLTIENSVEERIEMLEQRLKYHSFLRNNDQVSIKES